MSTTGTYYLDASAYGDSCTGTYVVNVQDTTGAAMFGTSSVMLSAFGCSNTAGGWANDTLYPRVVGDVNGDGLADIVGFGMGGVNVSLATGGGHFAAPTLALSAFGALNSAGGWANDTLYPRVLADVNGDGMADIVGFGMGGVNVSLATGGGHFAAPTLALSAFGALNCAGGWENNDLFPRELADVNGDGMADIVGFGFGGVNVALATGGGHFAAPTLALSAFGVLNSAGGWQNNDLSPRELADVNGDGMADIVGFGMGGANVSLATGGGHFAAPILGLAACGTSIGAGGWANNDIYPRELGDVNGDGMADILGFGIAGVSVALATGGGYFSSPGFAGSVFGTSAAAGGWTSQDLSRNSWAM